MELPTIGGIGTRLSVRAYSATQDVSTRSSLTVSSLGTAPPLAAVPRLGPGLA